MLEPGCRDKLWWGPSSDTVSCKPSLWVMGCIRLASISNEFQLYWVSSIHTVLFDNNTWSDCAYPVVDGESLETHAKHWWAARALGQTLRAASSASCHHCASSTHWAHGLQRESLAKLWAWASAGNGQHSSARLNSNKIRDDELQINHFPGPAFKLMLHGTAWYQADICVLAEKCWCCRWMGWWLWEPLLRHRKQSTWYGYIRPEIRQVSLIGLVDRRATAFNRLIWNLQHIQEECKLVLWQREDSVIAQLVSAQLSGAQGHNTTHVVHYNPPKCSILSGTF